MKIMCSRSWERLLLFLFGLVLGAAIMGWLV